MARDAKPTAQIQGSFRAAGLGVVFLITGVLLFFLAPGPLRWQFLVAGVFLGLFLIVVLGPRSSTTADVDVLEVVYEDLDAILKDLDLKGPGVYVPAGTQPHLRVDKVFIGAGDGRPGALPRLDEETTLYAAPNAGLALRPPGAAILDTHEQVIGVSLREAAIGELSVLLEGMSVGGRAVRGLALRRTGDTVQVQFRHGRYGDLCRELRQRRGPMGLAVGCPTCSALALAIARAAGQPAVLTRNEEIGGKTLLEVTLPSLA